MTEPLDLHGVLRWIARVEAGGTAWQLRTAERIRRLELRLAWWAGAAAAAGGLVGGLAGGLFGG